MTVENKIPDSVKFKEDKDYEFLYFLCRDEHKIQAYKNGIKDALEKSSEELQEKIKFIEEKYKEIKKIKEEEFLKDMEEEAKNPHKNCGHFHRSSGW